MLIIKISDSYKFASALKRTGVENSDPGAPRKELTAEPQWNCSFTSLSWGILKYSLYF